MSEYSRVERLESALAEMGRGMTYPATPDLAPAVLARLERVKGPSPRWLPALPALTTPTQLMELLDATPFLLLLEGVDDARNFGYTLRTAEALGADAVLLKKHLWNFDATDVSRASGGAFERLPMVRFEGTELLLRLKRRGLSLLGCLGSAKRAYTELDLARPIVVAIGGEKRGLSGATRKLCDRFMKIPTPQGSSLALSQAAAVVMGEVMRQRTNVESGT